MVASLPHITSETSLGGFGWPDVIEAMREAHLKPRPSIKDQFLQRGEDAFVNRAAWIEGLGIGVKSFTVFPQNTGQGLPSVQGAMLVFDDKTGAPKALIDSDVVTYWKTAADSVLGALLLARRESDRLLVIGTGVVADSLVEAYSTAFPGLSEINVWARDPQKARDFATRKSAAGRKVCAVDDLAEAIVQSDIVSSATMAKEPFIRGEWVRPGTHVDLIGAFKSDMREADDLLLQRARIYVDSFDTTIDHIGELKIPLATGVIKRSDVLGDLYDLSQPDAGRTSTEDITLYKNGGGAHLDLMTASAILNFLEDFRSEEL